MGSATPAASYDEALSRKRTAMASAVSGLSPVRIQNRMPAACRRRTDRHTSFTKSSWMAAAPCSVRPCSNCSCASAGTVAVWPARSSWLCAEEEK